MEEDRINAFDMGKKAMERLSQTKRRKVDEGEETEKKSGVFKGTKCE